MSESTSRVWLDIDLNAIKHNFQTVKSVSKPLKVMTVLKADAYGLGIERIAQELVNSGADAIGVAELNEALEVINLGVSVHILGGLLPQEIEAVVRHDIVAPITDFATAKLLNAEAKRQNKTINCHLLIDTGMGRLGIKNNILETIRQIVKLSNLNCSGIYSHFPVAYENAEFSKYQIDKFIEMLNTLEGEGIEFSDIHIANSDGINNLSDARKSPFTMVRCGINLYGVNELVGAVNEELKPAVELKSRLVSVREIEAGETIGYGRTYKLPKKIRIGTVCAGYADGVPLSASNRGWVIINNMLCPILGRVSMDYITVSLESVPNAESGDEVTLIGQSADYQITVEDWAQQMGSIPYQVICSFGNRVERIYSNIER